MSKQANPTLVGAFVVGAVALAVAGILVFGSGDFFSPQFRCVSFFETSVTGLDEGAAVRYQGVKVGRVSRISAVWGENDEIVIPVEMTFSRDSVLTPSQAQREDFDRRGARELVSSLVERGLRAVLVQDSLLTGKLHVALQFYPESKPRFVDGVNLPEIPTLQAGIDKIAKRLEELPFDELVSSIIEAMDAIETLATKPGIDSVLAKLEALIARLDAQVDPLSSSTQDLIADLRSASADLSRLLDDVGARVGPVADAATSTLDESRATLASLRGLVGEEDVVAYRVALLLEELTEAARALRVLAETLERQPEALIKGKGDR
jgi:paraquat-inducible protein B